MTGSALSLNQSGNRRLPAPSEPNFDVHAAAHDVNNLLHVIMGCCERLRVSLSPEQREEIDHIAVAAEHAAALSSRVLGSGATDVAPIDLQAALLRLQGLLRRIAGDRVAFTLIAPPVETYVRMHQGDLAQVLVNLTVNARDAMPAGGRLAIDVSVVRAETDSESQNEDRPAGYVQLRVEDSGVGMSADIRERVFERFFTTKANEGTGHGLATVHSIVQQYGGTIEVQSEPGHGAVFLIRLPIIEAAAEDSSPAATRATNGSGATVVIVDDEPLAREIAVTFLEASGYSAIQAGSAREALELVATGKHPIDLVVADVTMPDATGIELARWLAEAAPTVPVILVSGDTQERVAADTPTPVAFLQKPFNQQALSAKVSEVLHAAQRARAAKVVRPGVAAGPGAPIDILPAAVFVVQDGRFKYVNRAFAALLGLGADQLIGRSSLEWVQPDDRDLFPTEPASGTSLGDASAATTQVRVRRGDGSERNLLVSTVPAMEDGAPSLLGVAIDVTLQPDAEIVAARMAALGRLAGGVAHDYNNLLLVIGGHLERLQAALQSESDLQRDVDAIARAADRARTLTDNLLSFGRRQLLATEPVDLRGVVTAMVSEVQSQTGQAIEMRVDCAANLPEVEADTVRLREVLWHLIENAREAMPHGGTLTLAVDTTTVDRNLKARWAFLSEGSLFVRLRVIDTGYGMPPSIAAHAFEPFFTTKGKGRGAGMGLASVYGIVKQSGGYVFAERTGEQGTCMTLLLPPMREQQSTRPPALPSPSIGKTGQRSRILLVEDDAGVRDLLLDLLQTHGYEVTAAESAETAQACAGDGAFDLLLTDLDLPQMDGARLAATLTAEQSQLQVIVMSGYPDDGTIDAALGRRPAFLRKPFTSDVLLAAIEKALGTTVPENRRLDRPTVS